MIMEGAFIGYVVVCGLLNKEELEQNMNKRIKDAIRYNNRVELVGGVQMNGSLFVSKDYNFCQALIIYDNKKR